MRRSKSEYREDDYWVSGLGCWMDGFPFSEMENTGGGTDFEGKTMCSLWTQSLSGSRTSRGAGSGLAASRVLRS